MSGPRLHSVFEVPDAVDALNLLRSKSRRAPLPQPENTIDRAVFRLARLLLADGPSSIVNQERNQ